MGIFFFQCCRDSPSGFPCTINYLLSKDKKTLSEILIHTLNILLLPEIFCSFSSDVVAAIYIFFLSVMHSTPKKDSRFQFKPQMKTKSTSKKSNRSPFGIPLLGGASLLSPCPNFSISKMEHIPFFVTNLSKLK